MKFIDEVALTLASGHGGRGAVSFRRDAMTPRGGPDGGDGGRGGHIIFRVEAQLNSLLHFRYQKKFAAPDGQPGGSQNRTGAQGEDLILKVPAGTLVKSAENGHILLDLKDPGQEVIFLKGGRGGKGNTFFKSSVNQAPEHAQPGEDGVSLNVQLELRLIADVGIIGYPNAGKSTLISRISAAKPKIADYPFTTLTPHLGVVSLGDTKGSEYGESERSLVVADIPGLVPGAHQGVGLGTQFLRHIDRTRLFIHLVDASEFSGRTALQDYRDINTELKAYDETKQGQPDEEGFQPLSQRPQLLVLNKIELISAERLEELIDIFKEETNGQDVLMISAATGEGISALLHRLSRWIDETNIDNAHSSDGQ